MSQAIPLLQHEERERRKGQRRAAHDDEARLGGYVRLPEKAVAKPVDHIEERVEVRHPLPELGQRMDRVEDAREKRERQDQEVLERGDLVELLGADARDE